MRGRALVVEDARIAMQLRETDWQVSMVEAAEAEDVDGAFDLLVCPLRLRAGCGARLLKRLKAEHPDARGLLVTDRLMTGDTDYLMREAVDVPLIRVPATSALLALGIAAS